LSPDERLTLIAQLWDSLDDHQVQLTPTQKAELDRRLATLDHDRAESMTWKLSRQHLTPIKGTEYPGASKRPQNLTPLRRRFAAVQFQGTRFHLDSWLGTV
jgi:putative addiction module component (TIGR02574 family)